MNLLGVALGTAGATTRFVTRPLTAPILRMVTNVTADLHLVDDEQIDGDTDPASSKLTRMLSSCADIGGVYSLTYSDAIVLTDDAMKLHHGGIPQGGWLLAAACTGGHDGAPLVLEDEEIVLLRVRETAPLPNERDLVSARLSVVRDAHASASDYADVLDVYTRAEHQQQAYAADVMGVFFTDDQLDPTGDATGFGAELDNVWASTRYRVFMPSRKALSWIASYPKADDQITLGTVRFSATRRNAIRHGLHDARVRVNVEDFISAKTFVAGATRMGKSNSMKILTTAVYAHAGKTGQRIGQVFFDPQGEYAKVNQQDGTGLRLLGGPDKVRIYTATPDEDDPQEFALRLNFFDTDMFDVVWSLVSDAMNDPKGPVYVRAFAACEFDDPDPTDYSALNHHARAVMAVYGLLSRAGYKGKFIGEKTSLAVSIKDGLAVDFNATQPLERQLTQIKGGSWAVPSPRSAEELVAHIHAYADRCKQLDGSKVEEEQEEQKNLLGWIESWIDPKGQFNEVREVFKWRGGTGMTTLKELRDFHSPAASGDLNEQVWTDMVEGRLVIIDLSVGSEKVTKAISERLIDSLVDQASARFRGNLAPVPFQVIVEEAHNLFERGRDVRQDPWVRMSKEAAKYKIGLMYATQEITSVDQRILSNTYNWIVAHLNSDIEIRELARYYDFGQFGPSIKRAEDKGYVRMKTASSPYIVPMQVLKFDHDQVNMARAAHGLPEIEAGR